MMTQQVDEGELDARLQGVVEEVVELFGADESAVLEALSSLQEQADASGDDVSDEDDTEDDHVVVLQPKGLRPMANSAKLERARRMCRALSRKLSGAIALGGVASDALALAGLSAAEQRTFRMMTGAGVDQPRALQVIGEQRAAAR